MSFHPYFKGSMPGLIPPSVSGDVDIPAPLAKKIAAIGREFELCNAPYSKVGTQGRDELNIVELKQGEPGVPRLGPAEVQERIRGRCERLIVAAKGEVKARESTIPVWDELLAFQLKLASEADAELQTIRAQFQERIDDRNFDGVLPGCPDACGPVRKVKERAERLRTVANYCKEQTVLNKEMILELERRIAGAEVEMSRAEKNRVQLEKAAAEEAVRKKQEAAEPVGWRPPGWRWL